MKILGWSIAAILMVIVTALGFIYFSPDYNMYIVSSGSMSPAINTGDMIISAPLGGSFAGEVKSGMIVTYERGEELVTHRVLSFDGDRLLTKGDASEDPDSQPVKLSEVRGVYLLKIPYVGYLSNFIRTKVGWFTVIIIPSILLVTLIIKGIVREALSSA